MLTNYISIQLNGQPFNCVSGISLRDMMVYLNFDLSSVVIEYNSAIVQNFELDKIIIVEGDKIECLTVVGGG